MIRIRHKESSGFRRHGVPVCTKNSDSDVLVIHPTEQRTRDDAPDLLDRARDRSIFVQRAVSSDFIVIACVGLQGQPQVRLAQGDDMVGTLATDLIRSTVLRNRSAKAPLGQWACRGCPWLVTGA